MSHTLAAGHALTATLRASLPTLHAQWRDPWCVIGSAALRLSGVESIEPHDVDLLCSAEDAERLAQHWSAQRDADYAPRDDERFRSQFARFTHLPLPVEVMGHLQVRVGAAWQTLRVEAIEPVDCHGLRIPVPAPHEQLRILDLFGRDKDFAKAAQLRRHLAGASPHVE